MFDVSWGEIAVLAGVGLTLLGRKDLPPASRALGGQVGRVVGMLRGARIRADRYATDHRLKKLRDEFKSGLRELDAVKAELAGSMTINGGYGYGDHRLGSGVGGVDRRRMGGMGMMTMMGATAGRRGEEEADGRTVFGAGYRPPSSPAWESGASTSGGGGGGIPIHSFVPPSLAPRSRTVAAVAEEEWERRGIGFRSIAEGGGTGGGGGSGIITTITSEGGAVAVGGGAHTYGGMGGWGGGGAVILSNHLRQSLIYDQYERTVREQDEALRSRVEEVRNERIADGRVRGGSKTVE
ncbi:hypothetical protein ACHAW5_010904 [Stephanodiscus triporus]|uniref:Sec-independent protein translocase protein TatB n=1 Tax=Stephanodiscus triporus TaxID=2934178 RepID=A0ABD3NL54_9STRA